MKSLITTLNSKFIHTALSLRLLYVSCKDECDIDFKEYTTKDRIDDIVEDLLKMQLDLVAFSTYIWNVDYIKEILVKLRNRQPNLILVLGGPEVSYEPEYFLNNFECDYVMSGEGETSFKQLLLALENNQDTRIKGISQKGFISTYQVQCDLKVVESFDSPYQLERDVKDLKNRIVYFESSRGCPYQCQYCLSSLEVGMRFFSMDYIKENLLYLINHGAKTIKFLDRSFNVNAKRAIEILDFIIENHREGMQFQFEINADVLDKRIMDFVNEKAPKNLIRFEIGIQSTYEPTNEAVKRRQDFEHLSMIIKGLMAGDKADLHLDLIAGLPHESYERFAKSFDDVFAFRAKELQLGFLKMLRGTSLRNDAKKWGYEYQEESPYEMYYNDVLSNEEREHIHIGEDMLEKYWNSGRCVHTLNYLFDHHFNSPFHFFHDFGVYYIEQGYKKMGYQVHELFEYLYNYLNSLGIDCLEYLLEDYFHCFKVKPKKWWPSITKQERNEFINNLDIDTMNKYKINKDLLFRYSMIEKINDHYMIVLYKDYECSIIKL